MQVFKHEKRSRSESYIFRISDEDKLWLEAELQKIYDQLNRTRKKDELAISKGKITIEALRLGLEKIKKDLK